MYHNHTVMLVMEMIDNHGQMKYNTNLVQNIIHHHYLSINQLEQ